MIYIIPAIIIVNCLISKTIFEECKMKTINGKWKSKNGKELTNSEIISRFEHLQNWDAGISIGITIVLFVAYAIYIMATSLK